MRAILRKLGLKMEKSIWSATTPGSIQTPNPIVFSTSFSRIFPGAYLRARTNRTAAIWRWIFCARCSASQSAGVRRSPDPRHTAAPGTSSSRCPPWRPPKWNCTARSGRQACEKAIWPVHWGSRKLTSTGSSHSPANRGSIRSKRAFAALGKRVDIEVRDAA